MIFKPFQNIQLSTLGLGCMRFPMKDKEHIDYEKAHAVMERAYQNGVNYYDTAWIYQAGDSERCLGAWLKNHPRDSVYITSKYHVLANPNYEEVFAQSLERLDTDYIDFYLIHSLGDNTLDTYLTNGCIEYFLKQKELGKIKYLGFSSHSSPETLARFADHHAWDFAQIQMNYYDWVYGTAAREYKILEERNIPIMVMEPVRGGKLAALTPDAEALLKNAHPDWSVASWALRFVKSHPQIQVVLSGMSNLQQMDDNVATFSDPYVFTARDEKTVLDAGALFKSQIHVPCTECRYCVPECPKGINIPAFLKRYNAYKINGPWELDNLDKVESEGMPWDCVACGACTGHCPQNIDIPAIMAELAERKK